MTISERKMEIVIDNYFNRECDMNTSIRQAFEKGFRIGVMKGQSAQRTSDDRSDLISRTKVISLLEMRAEFATNDDIHDELSILINKIVENIPVVEEVPVIRCKDCKFATITDGVYGREPEVKYCDIWFPNEAEYMPVNYYCASAERKEE